MSASMDDLLNLVPCGILTFSDEGKILRSNRVLTDWLGYGPGDLEGRSIDTILSIASRIFYNTHFFPLVKLQGRADEIFFNLITKEKTDIPILSNTIRSTAGVSPVNITVFMPVRQRKKYEEELLHARREAESALKENKALEALTHSLEGRTQELDKQYRRRLAMDEDIIQFSKIVSHDLQEPIRKIKLFANILESAGIDDGQRRVSALNKIQNAADRLTQLTTALQQYVTIGHDGVAERTDLNVVVNAAKEKAMKGRSFDNLRIETDPLPSIHGFPHQLELLFYHLFDNAIQFRNPDTELQVHIQSTLIEENLYKSLDDKYSFIEHLRVIFTDNGTGFDDQYKDYVFELIKKIKTGGSGVGVGLPLIKKIMDNHGGTVRIESEPGKGTQVFLVFPLKAPGISSAPD